MDSLLDQLHHLAPLAAEATEGPWHIVEDNDGVVACYLLTPQAGSYVNSAGNYNDFANVGNAPDAAFIAAARNLLTPENLTTLSAALAAPVAVAAGEAGQGNFQRRAAIWMQETFGPEVSADFRERGFRFGEEAIELLQANGTTKEDVLKLVDYVYARPIGELSQEVGGTMVTLAALCEARGLDLMCEAFNEQGRVESPAVRAKIQAKQEAKRARMIATPLPGNIEAPTV